jgi:hypothetical protein
VPPGRSLIHKQPTPAVGSVESHLGEFNAQRFMFHGDSVRARTAALTGVAIAAVVALVVAVLWLTGQSGLTAQDTPEPTASSVHTLATAPPETPATAPPTAAEIGDLESALRSADADSISRYVPTAPGQALEAEFPAQLASLKLSIQPASLKELDPGVWRVTAVDGSGGTWAVGLVRRGEQLTMFTAEKEVAE